MPDTTYPATRHGFMAAYEQKLAEFYPSWAHGEKLTRFMTGVKATIFGRANLWNNDGVAVKAAWKMIGQRGKPTYVALRALPEGTPHVSK